MSDKSVVVIGGGLAGLSAAITLQEAGRDVEIFEGGDRVGGRVASDHIDGFTLDRGFQLINANYPELQDLMSLMSWIFKLQAVPLISR